MAAPDRLAAQLSEPAFVDPDEHFLVERVVKKADAESVALAAIKEGLLRPVDIEASELEPMMLAWVPIWRLDVSVHGFHLGLSRTGGTTLPTGGTRNRDEVRLVLGRRHLAVDPTAKLTIEAAHMVSCGGKRPPGGELVQPDVDRDDAERIAKDAMRRSVEPTNALFSKVETEVRSVALVHYPLMIVRYRYAGEAKAGVAPENCHVAVSGRTGKIVSEKHPSALRALGSKIKRWFS